MKNKALSTIGNIIFTIVMIFFLLVAFLAVKSRISGNPPSIFGYGIYFVKTGSMEPTISTGSLVVVKARDSEDIKAGDVITFKSEKTGNLTTHRVMEVLAEDSLSFRTKGDANNAEDPMAVNERDVLGVLVFSIPFLGYIINFLQSNIAIIFIIIIFILLLFKLLNRKAE